MKRFRGIVICLLISLMFCGCGAMEQEEAIENVEQENPIVDEQEKEEIDSEKAIDVEDEQTNQLPFKNVEEIKKDILDNTDIVGMTENMYSEYYACFNELYLDDSQYTDEGYTATCKVEFTGGEYMLTQNYSLFYKVNEQGDNWELSDYIATDEMDIVNCVDDTSYLDEEYSDLTDEGNQYYSTSDLCGTYVYQAVKFPDNNRGGMDRKLWTVIITDDANGNYYLTCYTLGANEYEITSVLTEGDAICEDRYPIYYDQVSNSMKSVNYDISLFNYAGNGGRYCNRDFTKISSNELSAQEVINTWISDFDN